MNKYNLFELIFIRFPYDNGELTKICHALDSYCLSVGSSDQALFDSTSLNPVAARIFVMLLFWNFYRRTVNLQGSYPQYFIILRQSLILLHKAKRSNRHVTFLWWHWSALTQRINNAFTIQNLLFLIRLKFKMLMLWERNNKIAIRNVSVDQCSSLVFN